MPVLQCHEWATCDASSGGRDVSGRIRSISHCGGFNSAESFVGRMIQRCTRDTVIGFRVVFRNAERNSVSGTESARR